MLFLMLKKLSEVLIYKIDSFLKSSFTANCYSIAYKSREWLTR